MPRGASYARKEVRAVASDRTSDPTTPEMPDMGDQAFIRGLLGTGRPLPDGTDLDAPVAGVPARMPDEVWARLERAIHAEAAAREAGITAPSADTAIDGPADVVSFADAAERRALRKQPRVYFALAAAGALVFGGTVVMQTIQSRTPDPSAVSAAVERSAVEVGSADVQQAGANAPSRRVMATGVDYQPTTMASQISNTFTKIGAANKQAIRELGTTGPATIGSTGFTADAGSMRKCIDLLVDPDGVQALLVVRATYRGVDAGVIVVDEDDINPGAGTSADGDPVVHVYVVGPQCAPTDLALDATVEINR